MQTATNPQTGEKVVFQNGQWVPMGNARPAAPAPAQGPMVVGTPRPEKPQVRQVGNQLGVVDPGTGGFTPTYTAPDKPDAPPISWRSLSPQEAKERGLPVGRPFQISSAGEVKPVGGDMKADPKTEQVQNASALLTAAGVDLARGIDPISDLIRGSTSGRLQAGAANVWGAVTGDATDGMENIAKLQTLVSDMTLQLTGGSLGNQISNADREFIMQRVGNLGDPNVPASARLAAWEQVKARMGNILGVEVSPPATEERYAEPTPGGLAVTVTDDSEPAEAGPPAASGPQGGPLYRAFENTIAGIAEGAAAVPDAVNTFTGAIDSLVPRGFGAAANALGFEDASNYLNRVADKWQDPQTIGDSIRATSPVPQDTGAGVARFGANFLGGAAAMPQRAVNFTQNALIGSIPTRVPATMRAGTKQSERAGARDVAEAAADLGIEMMPADVGGPSVRRATAVAHQSPGGALPITRGAQRVTAQGQAARDRIAQGVGDVAEQEGAGVAARDGARAFIKRTSARGGDLYSQAERLAAGVRVAPKNAVAMLDEHIGQLSETPGGAAGLETLKSLRDDLAGGEFSVQGLRNMRTALRDEFASKGLRGSDLERRVNSVIAAASDDIVAGLKAQGKEGAAKAYQVADRYWRARLATIDETLKPIIGDGKLGGDKVFRNLMAAGKGDGPRLLRFMQSLPAEEAATVRATIIDNLGRSSAGRQNADQTGFSLNEFLTHWSQLTPRVRRELFDGETAEALSKLAKVADGAKQAQRFSNFSNTGSIILGGAQGVHIYTEPVSGVMSLAAQYGAGRFLASPGFARWLARAPRNGNPSAVKGWVNHLPKTVARTSPAFHQKLMAALNDNVGLTTRSVAGQNEADR